MTSKFEETFPKWISARRFKLPLVTVLKEKHGTRIKVHQTYDELVDYCYEVFKERFNAGWYNAYTDSIPSVEEYFLQNYKFPMYVAKAVLDAAVEDKSSYGIVKDIRTAIQNSKNAVMDIAHSFSEYEEAKSLINGTVDRVYVVQYLNRRSHAQYEGFQLSSYDNELVM